MRVLLTPRKWVQIKPSRRHAEARVGPESDRHTGPESDCHRQLADNAITDYLGAPITLWSLIDIEQPDADKWLGAQAPG